MIEGRHFRSIEARWRTLGGAIDRYIAEELPKKRDARMRRIRLLWWKEKLGSLKLADITPAILVEYRGVLTRGTFMLRRARKLLWRGPRPIACTSSGHCGSQV